MAVLPALVDRFETVTVGIENVRSVITGIVMQTRAGLAVVGRARRHYCLVERVHLGQSELCVAEAGKVGVKSVPALVRVIQRLATSRSFSQNFSPAGVMSPLRVRMMPMARPISTSVMRELEPPHSTATHGLRLCGEKILSRIR